MRRAPEWVMLFAGALIATGLIAALHEVVSGSWDGWAYLAVFVAFFVGLLVVEGRATERAAKTGKRRESRSSTFSPGARRLGRVLTWAYAIGIAACVVVVAVVDGDVVRAAKLVWASALLYWLAGVVVEWAVASSRGVGQLRRRQREQR